ncbi:hypothetical protein Lepto7376_3862 [[Leptolyngbya] sp. PCC 7376]|nr:hypothetical protein Lepto7376_3862 [[Leptolyngbya] sp. PCC 7376]
MEEVRLKLNVNDYIDANIIWARQSAVIKIMQGLLIMAGIYFVMNIVTWAMRGHIFNTLLPAFGLILVLIFAFPERLLFRVQGRLRFHLCRKQYSQEHLFQFNEQDIKIYADTEDRVLRWFEYHVITPSMILIFTTQVTFYLLPRKYFPSEEQYERVCEIVRNFPQGQDA